MTTSQREPGGAPPTDTRTPKRWTSEPVELRGAAYWLQENFIWVLVVLLFVVATLENPIFAHRSNLLNILIAAAPLGCLVLAQSLVLITGHIDLSTESNMIFCAVAAGIAISPGAKGQSIALGGWGWHWPFVIVLMLILGTLVGAFNGWLIAYLGMNPLMTTLAMLVGLSGLALQFGQGRFVSALPAGFVYVGSADLGGFPVSVIVLAILLVLGAILLNKLVLGRQMYAVGAARMAARTTGVKDRRVIFLTYVASGFLSAVAGILLVGRLGTASANISTGALFISVAAAVMGGVSLFGGRGTVMGMVGGLILMASISNALNLANFPSTAVNIVTGGVILVAVFFDAVRTRAWRI